MGELIILYIAVTYFQLTDKYVNNEWGGLMNNTYYCDMLSNNIYIDTTYTDCFIVGT